MRISVGSSDVCSSDLYSGHAEQIIGEMPGQIGQRTATGRIAISIHGLVQGHQPLPLQVPPAQPGTAIGRHDPVHRQIGEIGRSEEHTSELQSLMRISYAVFCLKKKKKKTEK